MEKVVTKKVRLSYVNVLEPRVVNGEEKYSVTLLIPKTDVETYTNITNALGKTLEEAIPTVFNGVSPQNPRYPLYDGDKLRPSGEPFGEECRGCWVITANSTQKPEVVDINCNPIMSKSDIYSGCYGRASIVFFAYNTNGNKGVGCGLNNVQKLEDGQPLSGRSTAAEDFGGANSFVAQPAQQPAYQQPIGQPMQNPYTPQPTMGPVNPVTGQPINGIYGVN